MGTPQGELFKLDSPLVGEIRGERSLMAFPFLSPFCGSGSPLAVNPMRGSPSRAAR